MKELGEYLKHTRVNNGVSLAEAAEDLELSTSQLENIESGNVRAFKDVFSLRGLVCDYAKYLGIEINQVLEEFNDFMFEHTSKISLDDILAAQKKLEEKEKKAISPYTKPTKKKVSILPFILAILCVVVLFAIIYVIVSNINKAPTQVDELMPREECVYEFTY